MKKRTKKNYENAFNQFKELSGLDENSIKSMDSGELARKIDIVFENTSYKPGTICTKIFGARTYILKHYGKNFPSSITVKKLFKYIPKKSNKALLTLEDVTKLDEHFLTVYQSTREYCDLRNYILFRLLAGTGQRISDILQLRVKQALQPVIHFKQEKTGRETFIPNPCLEYIIHYTHTLLIPESHYLFRSPYNYKKHINSSFVLNTIKTVGKAVLKRGNITPHAFRKYVITQLNKDGVSLDKIREVSGHADLNTLSIYIDDKAPVDNLTGRLLGK